MLNHSHRQLLLSILIYHKIHACHSLQIGAFRWWNSRQLPRNRDVNISAVSESRHLGLIPTDIIVTDYAQWHTAYVATIMYLSRKCQHTRPNSCWYMDDWTRLGCVLGKTLRGMLTWRQCPCLSKYTKLKNNNKLSKSPHNPSFSPSLYLYFLFIHSIIRCHLITNYNVVIMSTMASQITGLTIVYPSVYSGADQRKHQSSASLAFVRGIHWSPVSSPHKGPVTRKMFPFDDVIMKCLCLCLRFIWLWIIMIINKENMPFVGLKRDTRDAIVHVITTDLMNYYVPSLSLGMVWANTTYSIDISNIPNFISG